MNSQLENIFKIGDSKGKINVQKDMIVIDAIKNLPSSEKEIIILRIMKGYSVSDVSIVLDKSEEAVKSLQFSAITKLTRAL